MTHTSLKRHLCTAGLAVAVVLSATMPLGMSAQQNATGTTSTKPAKKKKLTKQGVQPSAGATKKSPSTGGAADPINPAASPEPPTMTTQGPPPPPTTPSTNAPQPAH